MPPLLPVSPSFAICLRCQFRYSHRLQLPRRVTIPPLRLRSAAFFATTLQSKATTPEPRELVILEPPGPRKSLHKYAPPPLDLDDSNLDSGIQQLLTFEFQDQNVPDATYMGILLCKPQITRVSRQRYEQIFTEINRAFIRPQLLEYYSRSMEIKPGKVPLGKTPKKAELLNEIMRSMWGIEITDEIAEREDVLRNREIKSSRRDIFFMIGEDGWVLRKWAQEYSTRIQVNVQTSILQLRGSLVNIEKIEAEMKAMLGGIVTEDIDLSWMSRLEAFNEAFITPIARITNTFIERVDENTIRVMALGPSRHTIGDARRLLFTSLDLQFRSSYSLLYNAPRGQGKMEGALYPFAEDPSLSWRFRGRDWGRWRDIKRKTLDPSEAEWKPLGQEYLSTIKMEDKRGLDGFGEVRKILDESASLGTVDQEKQRAPPAEYHAILGCLLHDSNGSKFSKGPQVLEEFIKEKRPKVLSQDFPGVPFIAQMPHSRVGPPLSDLRQAEVLGNGVTYSFILRFAPSPWSNRDTFEHFPPLEMALMVDPHSGEAMDPDLIAVHSESVADFLLPSQNCDLRFIRRVDVPLSLNASGQEAAAGGVTKEEMARFINESNLDLNPTGDDKLRASPQIKVSIPPWMMQHSPSSPTKEVDYIFTGMEFRRELNFDWDGFCMNYTVVEGGVSGGRKTEVKLICKTTSKAAKKSKGTKVIEEKIKGQRARKGVKGVKGSWKEESEEESGELGFRASNPEASESKKFESQAMGYEAPDSEVSEEQELGRYELGTPAFEAPAGENFSSFANSAMGLVKSLEKRLLGSLSGDRRILRR